MGCNCKGAKSQKLNNLDSMDHIKLVEQVFNDIIGKKPESDYDDLDWLEIYQAYKHLYPNASAQPAKDKVVNELKTALAYSQTKLNKKR